MITRNYKFHHYITFMNEKNESKLESGESEQPKNDEKQAGSQEESIEEKLKKTEEKLLRSLAEIENQRKRFEKEVKDAFEYGGFNFAKETLSLIDNLQRAKLSMKSDDNFKKSSMFSKFLKNIEIIEKDLISVFEKNNIKRIDCINKKFDPNFHQAMLEIEDESNEPGTVLQEIQPGYKLGERLLRPSFVGVSKKKAEKSEKKED
ncbi:MAG: nucleotide exchange factor GrpE [Candidatus Pelagibacter sp.]|nr:nucleotide exchange factor GrpE [Candidatus Pelagibacter sp.]|tara:strand:- start:226 stop:840 length:615 start_codon:yes stop_codon:yes gene_type:complete